MCKYTPSGEYSLIGVSIKGIPGQRVELIMCVSDCHRDTRSNRENLVPPRNGDEISKIFSIPELKTTFKDILSNFGLTHAKIKEFADAFAGLKFKAKIDVKGVVIKAWIEESSSEYSQEEIELLRSLL